MLRAMTNAALPARRPIVPEDFRREPPAGRAFTRAVFAHVRNRCYDDKQMPGPERVAETLYPHDKQALALTKAASSPATTGSSTWAGALSPSIVGDFLAGLAPESAAARLIAAGMRVDLTGVGSINVPHRSSNLANVDAQWVAEASPFPVKMFTLASTVIGPTRKLISSVVITRELAESSNGEQVVAQLLSEDIGASLDASVFSATAASSTRPAGILFGVAPITASAGGGEAALHGDIAALGGAVAAATGSDGVVFVASPAYAVCAALYRNTVGDGSRIWPSVAVAPGVLIAVQTKAFVSAFGATPRIYASRDAVVHLEDTTPLPIGTTGAPNTVAAPTSSMFQTDCISVRATLDAAWALREPGSVAHTTGATC
jgi:hypothetical protein